MSGVPHGPAPDPPPRRSRPPYVLIACGVAAILGLLIVAVLVAIAWPSMNSAQGRSRQKRAMADIRSLAMAVQAYAIDYVVFPPEGSLAHLSPDYIMTVPEIDPWGGSYSYFVFMDRDGLQHFQVISRGSDGAPDNGAGGRHEGAGGETTHCYENDIVWQDADFLVKPAEGAQRKCS